MEHTKKFVLMDPRFVRPSMRDKALSGLDEDISNILESDASDEIKAKSYVAALSRLRHISNPSIQKSKPAEKQAPTINFNYKKLLKILKQTKSPSIVKDPVAESLIDNESDPDSAKETNIDWEQLINAPKEASTPRPLTSNTVQNALHQSTKRNVGDRAHRYWADLSDSFDGAPKPRKSARQRSKRKAWVEY